MKTNLITFPIRCPQAANDDRPTGPGGTMVSISEIRRRTRMVRTLRGIVFAPGAVGQAHAA